MANGTTQSIPASNVSCKVYLFTLPYGRGSDWSTPYARILPIGRHLRKAHLCVAHPPYGRGQAKACPTKLSGLISSVVGHALACPLRCQMGIQSGANEDQDDRGQEDDGIVMTQAEGARAAGKH